MRNLFIAGLVAMLHGTSAHASDTRASLESLMKTGAVTTLSESTTFHLRSGEYFLSTGAFHFIYESDDLDSSAGRVRVRVWAGQALRWPGLNPYVIQVLDSSKTVLDAKLVKDEPFLSDAWATNHRSRLFIYIKCRERQGSVLPTYIFEFDESQRIRDAGIFLDGEEVKSRRMRTQADAVKELKEIQEEMKRKGSP